MPSTDPVERRFCNDQFSFPGQHTVFECEGRTFTVIWYDPDEDDADAD